MAVAYATRTDLTRFGVAAAALAGLTEATQDAALAAASALADGYIPRRFTPPLTAWGDDLKRAVAMIAAYDLLSGRGFDPRGGGTDENIRLRYEDAMAWLRDVSRGFIDPRGVVDATPDVDDFGSGAGVASAPRRGW